MADFYTRMRDKVSKPLFKKFQQGSIFLVRTAKTQVPGREWDVTVGAPSRTQLTGTAIPVQKKFLDGTRITSRDTQVMFSPPDSVVPLVTDQIEIDGRLMTTIEMKRLPDAGVIVAYIFFVKGS